MSGGGAVARDGTYVGVITGYVHIKIVEKSTALDFFFSKYDFDSRIHPHENIEDYSIQVFITIQVKYTSEFFSGIRCKLRFTAGYPLNFRVYPMKLLHICRFRNQGYWKQHWFYRGQ